MIFFDTFLVVSNNFDIKLNINETTMFINADDQNIFSRPHNSRSSLNKNNHSLCSCDGMDSNGNESDCGEKIGIEDFQAPSKQQFFYAHNFMISIVANDKTLEYERSMLNTKIKLNTLSKLKFDLFKVRNNSYLTLTQCK